MSEKWTTILIGNGLGMAIDPNHFAIDRGLYSAWSRLNPEHRGRIKNLITDKTDLNTEEQLDKHYEVIQACLMLSKIEQHSNLAWLHDDAKNFPDNFRDFIVNAALHFFEYEIKDHSKFNFFLEKLKSYILNHNTHLITLNYDKLIYDRFSVDQEVMFFDKGRLMDGFFVNSTGFTPSRLWDSSIGYYIHLHGSPLFYTNLQDGIINKSKFEEYNTDIANLNYLQEHLILCATKLKPHQISNSPLLRFYWDFFKTILQQSEKIILFGYSGNDLHVNDEIANMKNKEIILVEYSYQKMERGEREKDWANKLNLPDNYFNPNNLIWLDSILDYDFNQKG